MREGEASNRSLRKKEAHHQQGGDEREQEGKVGSDIVCRGMEIGGQPRVGGKTPEPTYCESINSSSPERVSGDRSGG